LSFGAAVRRVWHLYGTFEGRASRPEYWWWVLFVNLAVIAFFVLTAVVQTAVPGGSGNGLLVVGPVVLLALGLLALIVPTISVTVRRLHDANLSGWWWWVSVIPYAGGIILIVLVCRRSSVGPNNYGMPS
jgi:uncharacterized membrane protein YhaH (DUF805 family)